MFVGANKLQQLSELRCFGSWRGTVHHVFIQDQWKVNKTSHYVFLCRKPITGHSHQCLSVFHLIPFYPHEIPSTIFFSPFLSHFQAPWFLLLPHLAMVRMAQPDDRSFRGRTRAFRNALGGLSSWESQVGGAAIAIAAFARSRYRKQKTGTWTFRGQNRYIVGIKWVWVYIYKYNMEDRYMMEYNGMEWNVMDIFINYS